MIGGRLKAKTLAAEIWLKAVFSSSSAAKTESAGVLALVERLQRRDDQRAVGQGEAVEQAVAARR